MSLDKAKKLFGILPKTLKLKLVILQFLLLISSLLELCGIGAIMPFVAIVTDPKIVNKYDFSRQIFEYFNISTPEQIILFSGCFLFFAFILINAYKMLVMFIAMKVNLRVQNILTVTLFKYYIHKEYLFHTKNNSATLREKVFRETLRIAYIFSWFNILFSNTILTLAIGVTIFWVNPSLAVIIGLVLVCFYLVVYRLIRIKIQRNGNIQSEMTYQNSKVISEAFDGIREVKLLGKEDIFTEKIQKGEYAVNLAGKETVLLSSYPKNILEVLCIGLMVGISVFFISSGKSISVLLPILSLYAVSAYKLIPSIQTAFSAFTHIKENLVAFDKVWEDFKQAREEEKISQEICKNKFVFNDEIKFSNIDFSYEKNQPVLNDLNLVIKKNTSVGFVGSSGSGKTTILDLIIGFLKPDDGQITVDELALNEKNISSWRKNIGFVAQMIFLSDSSIAENIAFGEFKDEIDMKRVKQAATLANIHDYITEQPQTYDSIIGERGVQLSGGQRQRIGIARALYHDPDILIFDEATSALDGVTESAIIDAVHQFSHQKTILMIAHRITTLKDCDIIYYLDKGQIADSGTYEELLKNNDHFREMAKF